MESFTLIRSFRSRPQISQGSLRGLRRKFSKPPAEQHNATTFTTRSSRSLRKYVRHIARMSQASLEGFGFGIWGHKSVRREAPLLIASCSWGAEDHDPESGHLVHALKDDAFFVLTEP